MTNLRSMWSCTFMVVVMVVVVPAISFNSRRCRHNTVTVDALQLPFQLQQQQQSPTTTTSNSRRQFLHQSLVTTTTSVIAAAVTTITPSASYAATTTTTNDNSNAVIGKKAPTFTLPNSRGDGSTSLEQLIQSNKWTVLYFYPGAFTQGCTLEARAFQRDIDNYRSLNAQIVGVSVDPPEKNAQFCSSEGLDFYMLSDIGGRVSKLYDTALSIPGFGTFSNRQTYLIDPMGNLRYVFTDVESRIARHSGEVLEKLTEFKQATV